MPFCTECGNENDEESAFCMYCGAKLLKISPNTREYDSVQKYKILLTKAYEDVIEKYGGKYTDWYYVLFTISEPNKPKTAVRGTTLPKITPNHSSGGLARIHDSYIEYAGINDEKNIIFKNRGNKKELEIPKFYPVDDEYKRIVPFKSLTHTWGFQNSLNNRQLVFFKEIEYISIKPEKVKLKKPSFLKGQGNFQESFNKSFENYLKRENYFSKADEIKKLKVLLDDGAINEEEFHLFKKDLLND